IRIKNGRYEIIANNIIWKNGDKDQISLEGEYNPDNIKIDYNMCFPAQKNRDTHVISGDPSFMEYQRGIFFLKTSSNARGKGSREFAPSRDFFGNRIEPNQPIDLGCFPYKYAEKFLKKQESFYYGWPYFGRGETEKSKMPDLWELE
ncbi:MAG: hypothetical protein MUO43_02600, partial [Desulfobacterales bacterium]|nr:hypothetical protein [Desulfobacterales bacterium]